MRMRAAIFDSVGERLEVEEVDIAEPRRNEVRVKMTASGVCHSDLRILHGQWGARTPLVLGHEGAGIVESIGEGVTELTVGDVVALSWTPSCRRCRYCVSGRPQLCTQAVDSAYTNVMPDGTTRVTRGGTPVYSYLSVGSFAEFAVVPESGAIKVGADIDPAIAAIVGCAVTTGVGATMNTVSVDPGSTVLVLGAGGVGLSVIQGAVMQSPAQLIAVDMSLERLRLACSLGATHTIDASTEDVAARISELTGGAGVDLAFEAIGNPRTIEQAYAALAPGATAVVVGQVPTGSTITIDPMVMSGRELTLRGSNYGSARPSIDFPRILDLHRHGHLALDRLVTARLPLDEINEAFELLTSGSGARTIVEFAA